LKYNEESRRYFLYTAQQKTFQRTGSFRAGSAIQDRSIHCCRRERKKKWDGRFGSPHSVALRLCRYAGLLALSVMGSPWLNRGR
jgi:hypothetical protein